MREFPTISEADVARHVDALAQIGNLGEGEGFLRAAWSNEETAAMQHFQFLSREFGAFPYWDEVGNLYLRTPGDHSEIVQVGSHLDTVPNGGNYDGAAGIVAGFEAVRALHHSNLPLQRGLELVIWRGEESATFGEVYKGSKAAFGMLPPQTLDRVFEGITLRDAMAEQSSNFRSVEQGRRVIPQERLDSIAAYIELHIEQGTVLEHTEADVGIVTAIRGPTRYLVEVTGEFDHSGATPMGTNYRSDANLAMAHMQVSLDDLAQSYLGQGIDLVQTVGVVNSDPAIGNQGSLRQNALTKVSGYGYFTVDIRSIDNTFREKYAARVLETIQKVAGARGVTVNVTQLGTTPALELMDPTILTAMDVACERAGYPYQRLPSGGGHDAVVVSQQQRSDGNYIPVGMLFIPCRDGKSHSPLEFASNAAITKGANVLARTLYELAK